MRYITGKAGLNECLFDFFNGCLVIVHAVFFQHKIPKIKSHLDTTRIFKRGPFTLPLPFFVAFFSLTSHR